MRGKYTPICFVLMALLIQQVSAAQKIIGDDYAVSSVPNYDQDFFPIDKSYGNDASTEGGDCTPIACTMLNGFWDANGWPRLIPYGGNHQTANAWGIDTVVRKYKEELGYLPGVGTRVTPENIVDLVTFNKQGNAIVSVIHYFDNGASFSREDEDITSWPRIQNYLNNNRPCVLSVTENNLVTDNPQDTFKFENASMQGMYFPSGSRAAHTVCAIGWSDSGGKWVICNMGWELATPRAWFNYDSDDDWYISQITQGGAATSEDDDPHEDSDSIDFAQTISPGTRSNLRCLDTLIVGGDFKSSYGDWFKVSATAGKSLTVTIAFTHASGDLDLQLFGPGTTFVGSSTGSGNFETVTVESTTAGYYYIYVYGKNNAKNSSYSLVVNLTTPPSSGPVGPSIASVSPATLPTSALQQPIKIFGSGFTAGSTLLFNGSIASDPARLTFVNANEIDYNIIVASAGNWNVKVINGAQQSNLGYFSVVNPPPNTGSLTVNLSPPGAVSAGGQWRVDSGSYRNSGDVITSLVPGSYTVSFKPVSGYITPAGKAVNIAANAQTTDSGNYLLITPSTHALTLNAPANQGYINVSPSGSAIIRTTPTTRAR